MAQFREVDVSAKQRVKQRTKGYQEREPFRQAVANLTADRAIELTPESGESLRKLKLNLARAAKEVGRNISYGETGDNMIVAWLDEGEHWPEATARTQEGRRRVVRRSPMRRARSRRIASSRPVSAAHA